MLSNREVEFHIEHLYTYYLNSMNNSLLYFIKYVSVHPPIKLLF